VIIAMQSVQLLERAKLTSLDNKALKEVEPTKLPKGRTGPLALLM
jgi:hypothetical protein